MLPATSRRRTAADKPLRAAHDAAVAQTERIEDEIRALPPLVAYPSRPVFKTLTDARRCFTHMATCTGGNDPCAAPECTPGVARFKAYVEMLRLDASQTGNPCDELRRIDHHLATVRSRSCAVVGG